MQRYFLNRRRSFVDAALLIIFTFGVGIFVFLSMVESSVWKLIFRNDKSVADIDVRFVHQALQRLTSKLPASNGVVILSGVTLMVIQTKAASWSGLPLFQICIYLSILFVIVGLRKNPSTVKAIRNHSSSNESIDVLMNDIRGVGIDHHLGLLANLFALIIQLFIWSI
jgi:uncharacterized membrane protein SirB2